MYRSTLKSIFLLAVGKTSDIKAYGLDTFLKPFVEDLKSLYLDGLCVRVCGQEKTFYGSLLAVLADNLAAHSIGGFKQSSSFALRICRTCLITKDQAQTCFDERNCILRTPEDHDRHCELLTGPLHDHFSTLYGVNRKSILDEVPNFSVALGLPHDIMHDLYEGVLPYELKMLLRYCVQEDFFSIQELNDRISKYDFSKKKPTLLDPSIIRDPEKKIRQSASQMMSLCHELPMIIGDRIPEGDTHWHSFILLLKICSIAISTEVTHDTIAFLQDLIKEKLTLFTSIYPNVKLIPKMHYLVHYPSQMQSFGPLINAWTMRHEAKLSFIKQASHRGNFKNITKTVAKKHQLWLSYHLQCDKNLIIPLLEASPKQKEVLLGSELSNMQEEIVRHFPTITTDFIIKHPDWLQIQSSVYKKGMYVLINFDEIHPEFGRIMDIIMVGSDNPVLFYVQKYVGKYFDYHYFSYVIQSTNIQFCVSMQVLAAHHPFISHKSFNASDENLYIVCTNI